MWLPFLSPFRIVFEVFHSGRRSCSCFGFVASRYVQSAWLRCPLWLSRNQGQSPLFEMRIGERYSDFRSRFCFSLLLPLFRIFLSWLRAWRCWKSWIRWKPSSIWSEGPVIVVFLLLKSWHFGFSDFSSFRSWFPRAVNSLPSFVGYYRTSLV